jgi:hypothetical protein
MQRELIKYQYLNEGSELQKMAFEELVKSEILSTLNDYKPVVAGTFPLNIAIETSDLDILCQVNDFESFSSYISSKCDYFDKFSIRSKFFQGEEALIVNYEGYNLPVEIFCQDLNPCRQLAYVHMEAERVILGERNAEFRSDILRLKKAGFKTEPAFAKLLGLEGDPYHSVIQYAYEITGDDFFNFSGDQEGIY